MSSDQGAVVKSFPNDLEIVLSTVFPHPVELVFDAHSKVEHIRNTFAPYGEEVIKCEIDLKVGGTYHYVMLPENGPECSFRGTFLEIIPAKKLQQTWIFDGWPELEAIETMTFEPVDSGTRYSWSLKFANDKDRSRFAKTDGIESNFEVMRKYLASIDNK